MFRSTENILTTPQPESNIMWYNIRHAIYAIFPAWLVYFTRNVWQECRVFYFAFPRMTSYKWIRPLHMQGKWDMFRVEFRRWWKRRFYYVWPFPTYIKFNLYCCDTGRFSQVHRYRFGWLAMWDTRYERMEGRSDGPADYCHISRQDYDDFIADFDQRRRW